MVADKLTVISKAYGSDEAWQWESSGVDGYEMTPAQKDTVGDYIAISDHESTHSIPEAVRLGKELGVHAGSFHDGIYWNSDRSIT